MNENFDRKINKNTNSLRLSQYTKLGKKIQNQIPSRYL